MNLVDKAVFKGILVSELRKDVERWAHRGGLRGKIAIFSPHAAEPMASGDEDAGTSAKCGNDRVGYSENAGGCSQNCSQRN